MGCIHNSRNESEANRSKQNETGVTEFVELETLVFIAKHFPRQNVLLRCAIMEYIPGGVHYLLFSGYDGWGS